MTKALYIFFLLIGSFLSVLAQQNDVKQDSTTRAIIGLTANSNSPSLFVHFDKTVYSNNENVWFTGYLLNTQDTARYHTMSVALVNDLDRTVVIESRCAMRNGIGFGKATIPDSAPPGNYTFIVVTNLLRNKQPNVIFKMPITIRSANQPEFIASLTAVDTSINLPQQKVRLNVNFQNLPQPKKKGELPPELTINYYVGEALHPVVKGFGKTKGGVYDLLIPTNALLEGNSKLVTQLWYQDKATELSVTLPALKSRPIVTFYPEGGNTVTNLHSRVGWQVKTVAGAPLRLTAFLYKNNHVIDTITTDINGAGFFDLMPLPDAVYAVKLYGYADTSYMLPKAKGEGVVMSLQNGLVNDTILITIKSLQNKTVYLVGHNYDEVFFNTRINLLPGNKRMAFVLSGIPAGVSQLILLDSIGKRLADRLFFSHNSNRPFLEVITDKPQYTMRQKVTVKVKLNAPQLEQADVSIAAVQANRVPGNRSNNIADYFYWKRKLPDVLLPAPDSYQTNAIKEQLEAQLLVNAWRQYKETDNISIKPTGIAPNYADMIITGRVTYLGKPITKPVTIFNINNPAKIVTTDNTGKFELLDNDIKTDSVATLSFMVADKNAKDYAVYVNDPYSTNIQQLASALVLPKLTDVQGSTQYLYLPDKERGIKLKEVNIKESRDDRFYGTAGNVGMNSLNSSSYNGSFRNGDGTITNYTRVTIKRDTKQKYILQVNGILQKAPTFYTGLTSITEPRYLSTLFWNHHQKLLPGSETDITFNTGDISGGFKIIVQGKTAMGVVYGEALFNVNK